LSIHHFSTGTANGLPPLNAGFEIKDFEDVFRKVFMQQLEVLEIELVNLTLPRFGEGDCTTRNMMGIPERNLNSAFNIQRTRNNQRVLTPLRTR